MRERISLSDSAMALMTKMAEGNPGGLTVLMKLMDRPDGMMQILSLDDMNIRGSQIWVGFKDHCKADLDAFVQAIKKRDPEMVKIINKECLFGEQKEEAVVGGASFSR